jgi:hypothetical protein
VIVFEVEKGMKEKHIKRLNLKKTTLRVLTDHELTEARSGAEMTALCTTQTKSMNGCVWPPQEPTQQVLPDQKDPNLVQPLE